MSKAKLPDLSIIIPCYNEKENLEWGVLLEVWKYLRRQKYTWEVIISDDGSTDESVKIARKKVEKFKNFKVLKNPHGGKPSTLLFGVKKAIGRHILFSDMDQSTPIVEVEKLLEKSTKKDVGAVIGSRGVVRKDFPIYRKAGAIVFMLIRRALILPEIVDTQCGFKLFETETLKKVFPNLEFFRDKSEKKGWIVTSYDVELLHMIKKTGKKIVEVPVLWNDRDESRGKGSPIKKYFKESKEMFMQILRVKRNDLSGKYSLLKK